ncbi:MAG TPA: Gfo/Idh/MocA family oxidoreductase [Ilumatobacteraceae bacterium]|jgi:predicted dehydrogenase
MVRVGLVGTSWWAEAMYLPALADHPAGRITALCGRDPDRTRDVAASWVIPNTFTDWSHMLDSDIDAVIVASPNETHFEITMAALARHLPVLCEKPLGMNATEAARMAAEAARAGVTTMVPFTYRYMPTNQYVKQLIEDGYVGQPYQLSMRYFAGYARDGAYAWRFDESRAGSGIIGDLGSHWLDMARWFLGELTEISAHRDFFVPRGARPDNADYVPVEDSAVILARSASGATAVLQVSAVCWEGTPFGQVHSLDLHGSEGTLHAFNDWDKIQEVRGVRAGERGPARVLDLPDSVWNGAPHSPVHDTYRHVFRRTEAMTRGWLSAVAEGRAVEPDLAVGARVQRLVDAAIESATSDGGWRPTPTG